MSGGEPIETRCGFYCRRSSQRPTQAERKPTSKKPHTSRPFIMNSRETFAGESFAGVQSTAAALSFRSRTGCCLSPACGTRERKRPKRRSRSKRRNAASWQGNPCELRAERNSLKAGVVPSRGPTSRWTPLDREKFGDYRGISRSGCRRKRYPLANRAAGNVFTSMAAVSI